MTSTTSPPAERVTGLLLAAGGGRRAGGPKALRHHHDGRSWLATAVGALLDGGCQEVVVVLGAEAAAARDLLLASVRPGSRVSVVANSGWAEGMAGSLAAGLRAAAGPTRSAVLVHLVDLPDVDAAVVARVLGHASGPAALARAGYTGRPGHPVLVGRDHVPDLLATLTGDRGARAYLDAHDAVLVECGDLACGADVDGPAVG